MRILDQLYMTTEGIFGHAARGVGIIRDYFRRVRQLSWREPAIGQLFMDFAMALTGHSAGGPGKVSVHLLGAVRHHLRQRGCQRYGRWSHFNPADEALRLSAAFRRRRRGDGLHRRPDRCRRSWAPPPSSWLSFSACAYGQVVIWAIIPAILYYVACFAAVHFEAKRRGLLGVPRAELPRLRVGDGASAVTCSSRCITLLVVMYSGYSAPLAALAGTLACFPVAALRKSTRQYVTLRQHHRCLCGRRHEMLCRSRSPAPPPAW